MDVIDIKSYRLLEDKYVNNKEMGYYVKIFAKKAFDKIHNSHFGKKVLVLCGSGGNGADGLEVASLLDDASYDVDVFYYMNHPSKLNLMFKNKYNGKILTEISSVDSYDFILDALFGIGLNKAFDDELLNLIKLVNKSNKKVISFDIPSGLNGDSGLFISDAIKAYITYTVEYPKLGMLLNDGLDYTGKIEVIKVFDDPLGTKIHIADYSLFKDFFPIRKRNSHKGNYPKSAIIAGSLSYPGASKISESALSAFMMGEGYTRLYVPKEVYSLYALTYPELIVNSINSTNGVALFDSNLLDEVLNQNDSIAIGMGMTLSLELFKMASYLLKNSKIPMVFDADILNTIAKYKIDLNHQATLVLTPHIKEFSRLCNKEVRDVLENMYSYALSFAKENHLILVLKSSQTIVTDGSEAYLINAGTSGLSKAGSGDMLSGIMAGTLSYHKDPLISATLASFILGKANEFASESIPYEALRPTDTISNIGKVIKQIKEVK